MTEFLMFFMVAVLVERLTEYIKKLFGEAIPEKIGTVDTYMLVSLVIGLAVAVGLQIDIFKLLGFDFKVAIIGQLLTGLIVSGGSNYLFDIVGNFKDPIPIVEVKMESEKQNI